jgi:hypothetical protein
MILDLRPLLRLDVDGVLGCFCGPVRTLTSFKLEFRAPGPEGAVMGMRVRAVGTAARVGRLVYALRWWGTSWAGWPTTQIARRPGVSHRWVAVSFGTRRHDRTPQLSAVERYRRDGPYTWVDEDCRTTRGS